MYEIMRFCLWIPNPYYSKKVVKNQKHRTFHIQKILHLAIGMFLSRKHSYQNGMGYCIQSTVSEEQCYIAIYVLDSQWRGLAQLRRCVGSDCPPGFEWRHLCLSRFYFARLMLQWHSQCPSCLIGVCVASSLEPEPQGSEAWLHTSQHRPDFKFPARTAHAVKYLIQQLEMRKSQ